MYSIFFREKISLLSGMDISLTGENLTASFELKRHAVGKDTGSSPAYPNSF